MINVKNIDGIKIRSVTGKGVIDGNGQNAYATFLPSSKPFSSSSVLTPF